jgi:hypothetical protein
MNQGDAFRHRPFVWRTFRAMIPPRFHREIEMRATLPFFIAVATLAAMPTFAAQSGAPCAPTAKGGGAADVATAVAALRAMLNQDQLAAFERPLERHSAIQWSNLPDGIVKRTTLRMGNLDPKQAAAARHVMETALSACGIAMLDEIRLADDFLTAVDERHIGWTSANYFIAVLGTPGGKTPWMLQFGGHHLAYNFTFNGRLPGATPMFLGTEPIRFEMKGAMHEPLSVQSTAMARLATAIAPHAEAKLSGTFTDVVKGVVVKVEPGQLPTGGTDTGFPQTYPAGANDRGIEVGALTKEQRALVRAAIDSFATLPGTKISAALRDTYESSDALDQTYVGFAGSPDLSTLGSYVRIDGPRVWMELVVQKAIANPSELHYHALWRDKQSDYGGEVGQ